jgi:hypothetical protein
MTMTNDFVEITGADSVQADALRLSAAGNELDAQAQARVSDISSIEAEQPWGDDKYGVAFFSKYDGKGEAGGIKESLIGLGSHAVKIGDATLAGMLDYTSADDANAAGIKSVRPPKE